MFATEERDDRFWEPRPLAWDDAAFLSFVYAQEKKYADRLERRECARCGVDISDRHKVSQYCLACSTEAKRKGTREWLKERRARNEDKRLCKL